MDLQSSEVMGYFTSGHLQMIARSNVWFRLSISLVACCSFSFTQTKTPQDSAILRLIKNEVAFQHWQTDWQDLLPTFNLDNFWVVEEHEFKRHVLDSFPTFDISKIDHPAMIAFSPNGLKAVAYGYAQTCGDDYCSVYRYDLQLHKVFELTAVGMNYPPFNGFAWLSNDLLIMIGEAYHFTKETVVIDSVAPSISVFDFGAMTVRVLRGGFIPKDEYFKNPDDHVRVEPDLILDYKQ